MLTLNAKFHTASQTYDFTDMQEAINTLLAERGVGKTTDGSKIIKYAQKW